MKVADIIQEASSRIRQELQGNCEVFLFGSFAKGNALSTSDIDIAVSAGKKIPFKTMLRISDAIETIRTLRSIDVIDLFSVDKNFRTNILKHAKKI